MYITKAILALTMAFVFIMKARADGPGLTQSQLAPMRRACESQLRRYCSGPETYENVKACIKKSWERLDNNCQYEITSLVPLIQAYEERKARQRAAN